MSEHGHEHQTPQPVMVPFILLCLAIAVIYSFGVNTQINVEQAAGEGLAGVHWAAGTSRF